MGGGAQFLYRRVRVMGGAGAVEESWRLEKQRRGGGEGQQVCSALPSMCPPDKPRSAHWSLP